MAPNLPHRASQQALLVIWVVVSLLSTWVMSAGPAHATDRIEVPGGTEALARLVGHVDLAEDRFAASLNRVLLRRIHNDHSWESVADRRLLSDYVATVTELGQAFPDQLTLRLEDERLPQSYLDLAAFFGFQYRGGEWVAGTSKEAEIRRAVALALNLNIGAMGYQLLNGETIMVDLPTATVAAPLPLDTWSTLVGRPVTAETALLELIQDQRLGLLLEGLRRADPGLSDILGAEALQKLYLEGSLSLFRYGASIQFQGATLQLPGGSDSGQLWKKLVGVSPANPARFLESLLQEADNRAAHFWSALYFATPKVSEFVLGDKRLSASMRGPLLDYVERIFVAEGAGLLQSGRGGDYSLATLVRGLPLSEPPDSRDDPRAGLLARSWIERRGIEQACLDEARLRRIVTPRARGKRKKRRDRGIPPDRFLEHLLSEVTPLHGSRGLLFQPFMEVRGIFEAQPELLTPINVLLLRRAAGYRPLLIRSLIDLPLRDADQLTEYLLTAENLDCLNAGPERDSLTLRFQGGVELLSALRRGGTVEPTVLAERLDRWTAIHRELRAGSTPAELQLAWLRETLGRIPPPQLGAPGRGPAEARLLRGVAGTPGVNAFTFRGLRYSGSRRGDLAAEMAAFLVDQSVAPVGLLTTLQNHLSELERTAEERQDMQMRLTVFQILALLKPLGVPTEARVAGLERPEFAASVQHRLDLEAWIEKAWRGKPRIPQADIAKTQVRIRRVLQRELEALLCSIAYLRPITLLGNPRFNQPLFVLRHTIAREIDPQGAVLERFPSAWTETVVVPAAFSPAGAHVAGALNQVSRALIRHHVLSLAPERPPHTWIDVRPWLNSAMESSWADTPASGFQLVGTLLDAGSATLEAFRDHPASFAAEPAARLARLIPAQRRRTLDTSPPLIAPSERLQAGLLLLEFRETPKALRSAQRDVQLATDVTGPAWRQTLDALGVPTFRMNGHLRPSTGPWPTYEALEREASVTALRERQLIDVWISVIDFIRRRGLPAPVGYDLLLRVLEDIPERVVLETERDWESLIAFTTEMDETYFEGRLQECLMRGLYSVESF